MPVFEHTLDDMQGVVYSQDLLQVADADLTTRRVRELMKPVMFMPETKIGSELLREMRQRDQSLAVIIDEHGSMAGIATMEDLVEEIVGESGVDGTHPKLEAVREGTSSLVMRGTTAIADVEDMLGVQFGESADETVTTIAGLLSHVSGRVPPPGEKFDLQGFRFEVLEANQRKVLRVRIQKLSGAPMGKA
jgi:CBS domain containing-hemolysin-like protein